MIVWLRHKCLGLNTVPDESITSLLENKGVNVKTRLLKYGKR